MLARDGSNVKERVAELLYKKDFWAAMLTVDGERLPDHEAVLALSSFHFRDYLREHKRRMLEADKEASKYKQVKGVLRLMNYVNVGRFTPDERCNLFPQLEILEAVHRSGFDNLRKEICRYLEKNLAWGVSSVYERAHSLQLDALAEACHRFMDENPDKILREGYSGLPSAALAHILSRDTFCVEELKIFNFIQQLIGRRVTSAEDKAALLAAVRLPLIPTADLETTVRESGLVPEDRLQEAIRLKECAPENTKYRGLLARERNLARYTNEVLFFTEPVRENPLTLENCPFDPNMVFPPSEFEVKAAVGLTVALRKPSFINHLKFGLPDEASFSCSYSVEVSPNFKDWIQVVDHSKYPCRSSQMLYFEPLVSQFIRIIFHMEKGPSGLAAYYFLTQSDTENNLDEWTVLDHPYGCHLKELSNEHVIKVSNFEVSYTESPSEVERGFLLPVENMASEKRGAIVIRGKNQIGGLISGKPARHETNTGWTWHAPGSSIIIQLPQPCIADSMRLFLNDTGSQKFAYRIETSLDMKHWTRVADRTSDYFSGWQILKFEPQLITFIEITATSFLEGWSFEVAHFECPAQIQNLEDCSGWKNGVIRSTVRCSCEEVVDV